MSLFGGKTTTAPASDTFQRFAAIGSERDLVVLFASHAFQRFTPITFGGQAISRSWRLRLDDPPALPIPTFPSPGNHRSDALGPGTTTDPTPPVGTCDHDLAVSAGVATRVPAYLSVHR